MRESPKRVVALDRMTAAERATFVRSVAKATLRWALDDLERKPSGEADIADEIESRQDHPRRA